MARRVLASARVQRLRQAVAEGRKEAARHEAAHTHTRPCDQDLLSSRMSDCPLSCCVSGWIHVHTEEAEEAEAESGDAEAEDAEVELA